MQKLFGRPAAPRGGQAMWVALAQTVACSLPISGCGGGGGGPEAAATVVAAAPVDTAAGVATAATASPASPTSRADVGISFTLAQERSTSAGVYASDGTLVRTLWRGERLAAGSHARAWDQRSDSGAEMGEGAYTIKVVHHDVRYVWDGVVGNSSAQAASPSPHRAFQVPTSLATINGRLHFAVGYNEFQQGIQGFDLASPQVNRSTVKLADPFVGAAMIATDGERLYWVNTGGIAKKSFVAAFDLATGAQSGFAGGTSHCLNYMSDGKTCYTGHRYDGVLEFRDNADSPPTGLAVQRAGRILAVAYGADNEVRLYDKRSGQLLQVLSVALAAKTTNQIAITPKGDLWVLSVNVALRYTALGSAPAIAASTGALVKPLAITVDPQDDDVVWVADGGSSQQLKRFDNGGSARQTVGQSGGAAGNAQVADNRFCFQIGSGQEQAALAVDETHALWVVDGCNSRTLKLAPDGSVADQVAYLAASYVAAVDTGNPTRVFSNYLEFSVDYSKDLTTPQSWTLVRNWLPALPASLRDANSTNRGFGGFTTVQTLANGRTYALLRLGGRTALVELTAGGTVRAISDLRTPAAGETAAVLYEDGALGYARTEGARQTVLRLALERFDGSGNPVWSTTPVTLASAPVSAQAPTPMAGVFSGSQGPRFPVTGSGKVVFFNPSVDAGTGFHLGAVAQGASAWAWQASPSAPMDGLGSFQTRKDDPGIQYGGNTVYAVGRNVVYGYHGEFYRDLGNGRVGQANQFMHFRDDGLFIGQFGVPSTRLTSPTQAGLSGNAFSPTLVRSGNRTYLYHNDESSHGGVHRWQLQGADDVQELVGTVSLRSAVTLR